MIEPTALGSQSPMKPVLLALILGVVLCSGSQASNGDGDFANANIYVDGLNAVRARVQKPAVYKGEWKPLPPLAWSDEGKHYSYSPVYDFYIPTGHYTQVVWRKTTFVGCGRATCGKETIIVCQ